MYFECCFASFSSRCLAVSPNFEIAKNNMAIALTDLGTKVLYFHFSGVYFNIVYNADCIKDVKLNILVSCGSTTYQWLTGFL